MKKTERNQVTCKTITNFATTGSRKITGRLRLFEFSSTNDQAGGDVLFLKNGNRSGEIIAPILTPRNVGWGVYQGLYNFGKDGILFPDGLFMDFSLADGTSYKTFVSASFFYQGA